MKIGVDYIAALAGGGNATYTRELLTALAVIDQHNEYYLFSYLHDYMRGRHPQEMPESFHDSVAYVSPLGLPIPASILRAANDTMVRLAANRTKLDVVHFTNPLHFVETTVPTVVTIHDLAPFHAEGWTRPETAAMFRDRMQEIISRSRIVIAVSAYTKKDLVRELGVDPAKIMVIYEAAGEMFYPDPDPDYIRHRYNAERYVLYVGQLQPRKNIANLIDAFGKARLKIPRLQLLLVGQARDSAYRAELQAHIASLGLEEAVRFLGHVDDTTLRKLYSSARAFIYPSLFEGFGLPIIESLSCGTPVITSNVTSLPEVAGDAGLVVDPRDAAAMAEAIERLYGDEALYLQLREKALSQAAKFSWNKAAQETLAAYQASL